MGGRSVAAGWDRVEGKWVQAVRGIRVADLGGSAVGGAAVGRTGVDVDRTMIDWRGSQREGRGRVVGMVCCLWRREHVRRRRGTVVHVERWGEDPTEARGVRAGGSSCRVIYPEE